MFAEIADVEVFTGGLFDQLRGCKAAAMLPDVLTKPIEQRGKITVSDGCIKTGQRFLRSTEQLRGVHRS